MLQQFHLVQVAVYRWNSEYVTVDSRNGEEVTVNPRESEQVAVYVWNHVYQ